MRFSCLSSHPPLKWGSRGFRKLLGMHPAFKVYWWCYSLSYKVECFHFSEATTGTLFILFIRNVHGSQQTVWVFFFFFLTVIMMSWFCSRLIAFPSTFRILQADMVKYLRSRGSSWEASGLGDRTALGCRWTTLSRYWTADRWWLVRTCFIDTFCREDGIVPNEKQLIFYTRVSPALIHFWILWAEERCCLMETYLPERTVTMAWVRNGKGLWKRLQHGGVDKALLMW